VHKDFLNGNDATKATVQAKPIELENPAEGMFPEHGEFL
jgi:hypothetical protein